ncbi:ABC transporter ATP-binding protein [Ichthyenterobacterium sp. W332]|uniref:ABC transporter ATP-binding protein n=1 Tax=Microcosmobacter mediterraneus TaxID=3075607 RepID=A0ABU2YIX3_9FLAO|nr:ABC transporter ATP-binding protein [Ichthyenterobacterium sp. W332]MDT0558129.1 ABC transporter ATP-binding protein [Ichthyenterobacterium sp. W332]
MLQIKDISFSYNVNKVIELNSLQVNLGKTLAVIGESGSGKSTLLKLIYGQYDLPKGEIFWKDTQILGPAFNLVIGYDFMKYVAQEFELMPYITVQETIGQYLSSFYKEKKQKRIEELLKIVELTNFSQTKIQFLSGGQKQRVALAKALAKEPEILLLDEPFSHIDNFKKQSLRRSLFSYLKQKKITSIVATHDKDDVLGFADNMLVLHKGKQLDYNTPQDLYHNPKHPLIASFFGEYNIIDNKIVYAHQIKVIDKSELKAKVKNSYFKGHYFLIEAELDEEKIVFTSEYKLDNERSVNLKIKT